MGRGGMAFEAVWTLERYDALHRILVEVPVTWRFFVKHRVFAALRTARECGRTCIGRMMRYALSSASCRACRRRVARAGAAE